MIQFNVPPCVGTEIEYIRQAIESHKICGDGDFTKRCSAWLEENLNTPKALLTTSCTHATEMAALLLDLKEGDEVIMPSYTFVSTADAFVLRGAKAVFVDIRPDTMNIDERLIENAVTDRTRAIVSPYTTRAFPARWTGSWRSPESTGLPSWRTPPRVSCPPTRGDIWGPSGISGP